ncbi:hypothetical protein LBMAG46_28740 [Planctomycetia bacterium]|nr:hypothetical protein LBMAG46_28740 [Planctomycetia bacterium]
MKFVSGIECRRFGKSVSRRKQRAAGVCVQCSLPAFRVIMGRSGCRPGECQGTGVQIGLSDG